MKNRTIILEGMNSTQYRYGQQMVDIWGNIKETPVTPNKKLHRKMRKVMPRGTGRRGEY